MLEILYLTDYLKVHGRYSYISSSLLTVFFTFIHNFEVRQKNNKTIFFSFTKHTTDETNFCSKILWDQDTGFTKI